MRPYWLVAVLLMVGISGCFDDDKTDDEPGEEIPSMGGMTFAFSDVGRNGPEPSIGVTSTGCMFFPALMDIMRSCDQGATWEHLTGTLTATSTSDPWLWVDPATDRIFAVQMGAPRGGSGGASLAGALLCSHIDISDDDGETWLSQPLNCGPLPVNDHIKLGSGPWTTEGYGQGSAAAYPSAIYYCYNKLVGVFCYTSFDGGLTFTGGAGGSGLVTETAGLHGAITTGPDGTVYLPPRTAVPTVFVSKDNGLNWEQNVMGGDVGTPSPRKNSEIGTDANNTAYHVWVGEDQGVYMSRSFDSGSSWEANSTRVSPEGVISAVFPHIDGGDAGRVAVAYLGSEDAALLETDDIDGNEWNGNAHYAPDETIYHAYLTYSLDADQPEPTFTTIKLSEDPVQVGSICLSSGDCRDIGGSNRNLLDFNDLTLGPDGRLYFAFTDGCTDFDDANCASDDTQWTAENSRSRRGSVYVQTDGPSLLADVDLSAVATE